MMNSIWNQIYEVYNLENIFICLWMNQFYQVQIAEDLLFVIREYIRK